MEEPRTHYQLSFTAKQALLLFMLLIGALGVAYFLGLMTGLSGREPASAAVAENRAAAAAAATPTPETLEFPRAVRGVSPHAAPVRPAASPPTPSPAPPFSTSLAAPAATPTPGLQLFEDAPPVQRTAPANAFWVQALSANSEKEAHARRDRLAAHGFPAAVVPGPGPHGRVYRVRVGPYASRDEAQRAATRLKAREKLEPWIVPPGK